MLRKTIRRLRAIVSPPQPIRRTSRVGGAILRVGIPTVFNPEIVGRGRNDQIDRLRLEPCHARDAVLQPKVELGHADLVSSRLPDGYKSKLVAQVYVFRHRGPLSQTLSS